jgi:hypothetical protein
MWSSAVFVDYVKAWRWPGHNQDEVALGCDVEWRGWGACRRAYGGRGPGVAGAAGGGGAARVARGHARGAAGAGVRPGWDVGLCELFAYAELTAHVHWQPYRAPTLRRAGAALSAAQARACGHDADSLQPCLHVLQSRASVPGQWPARSRGRHFACCLVRCWWPLLFANWALVG